MQWQLYILPQSLIYTSFHQILNMTWRSLYLIFKEKCPLRIQYMFWKNMLMIIYYQKVSLHSFVKLRRLTGHFRNLLVNIKFSHCETTSAHPPICIWIPIIPRVTYFTCAFCLLSLLNLTEMRWPVHFNTVCLYPVLEYVMFFQVEKENKKKQIQREVPRIPHKETDPSQSSS